MKVSVYLSPDGSMDALVTATVGKGMSPVLVKDVTPENVVESIRPVIDKMRLPRATTNRSLGV